MPRSTRRRRGGARQDPQSEECARVRGGERRPARDARAEGGVLIRFSLACDHGHEFEGWFRSNDDFDKQKKRGLVDCPACGSHKVDKALMAPAVSTGRKREKMALAMGERAAARVMARDEGAVRKDARECRLCRRQIRRGSAQDPFRRDRGARHLRRGDAGRGEGAWPRTASPFMPIPVFPDDRN